MNTVNNFFWKRIFFFFNFSVICILLVSVTYFAGEKITSLGSAKDTAVNAGNKLTVIIDAGHGGLDGGASTDGGVLEKHLNLAVAKKLAALFSYTDIDVVMTRESDVMLASPDSSHKKRDDLNARLHMADNYENCIFISIHMNKFPEEYCHGLTVYYSGNDTESEVLGRSVRDEVVKQLQKDNERPMKRATSALYVLHRATVPAILIECGFLSNRDEEQKLLDENYKKKLAMTIVSGLVLYAEGK